MCIYISNGKRKNEKCINTIFFPAYDQWRGFWLPAHGGDRDEGNNSNNKGSIQERAGNALT